MRGFGEQFTAEFGGPLVVGALRETLDFLRQIQFTIDAIKRGNLSDAIGFYDISKYGDRAGLASSLIRARSSRVSPPLTAEDIKTYYDRTGAGSAGEHPDVTVRKTVIPTEGGDQSIALGSKIAQIIERIESGGDPNAKNPRSSASGLGQFTDDTFVRLFRKEFQTEAAGLSDAAVLAFKSQADIQRRLIDAYAKENAGVLARAGIAITDANLYLAHFLGAGGALKILKADPNASAESVLGAKAARANPTIIGGGHTAQDVIDFASRKTNAARLAIGDLTPQEERDKDLRGSLKESDERTAALQREADALHQNSSERAYAAEKARLLNDIEKEGRTASPEEIAQIDAKAQAYARMQVQLDGLERASQGLKQAEGFFAEQATDAISGLLTRTKTAKQAIADLVKSLAEAAIKATFLGQGPLAGLFGMPGKDGGVGGIFGAILSSFGGQRAKGGPVSAGKAYLVGEEGPEIFRPGGAGSIVPNGKAMPAAMAVARAPAAQPASAPRINPHLSMSIDLKGANGDATIQMIAERAARAAGQQAYALAVATSDKRVPVNQDRLQRRGHV